MNPGFVLVTGASGFVGGQLVPELLKAGWRVRATYCHSTAGKCGNGLPIEWCKVEPLGKETNWMPLLAGGITEVVHLAALAHKIGPREVTDSAYDEANHWGTACLAEQAASVSTIRRFIFVSSIGAMASLSECRLDESSPCNPDTPYGRSKLSAERALQDMPMSARIEWCILRPPLLFGPGNPGNMGRLISLMNSRLPLPLGSIRNQRTFLYVGNLVDAIKLALTHPAAANRLYCVGDTETLSTPDLIRGLSRASGQPARMYPFPVTALRIIGQLGSLCARIFGRSAGIDSAMIEKLCGSLSVDSSRFRRECGWNPPFSIEEGLRATIGSKFS